MFGISLFKKVSFFFKDITYNSNFSHLYTEMPEKERGKKERKKEQKKERKKERKRAKTLKSAHLWLLLIVINLTYTRIGFVSLI